MTEQKQPRTRMKNADYGAQLMDRIHTAIKQGMPPEQAVEKAITARQYDWLCDHDYDLDVFTLGKENACNAKAFSNANRQRRLSPAGYDKKYPVEKQVIHAGLVEYLKSINADIIPREKENFRDIEFYVNGTKYKIVFSSPRS